MPKHEPMTAKAIGKKIKSKGLQKLKFFCQMCQKQCRDANGFKCHLTSEAHQRQLLLFGENPGRYLNDFSSEFMKDFLHLLKRRYNTKRVFANQVYQEYIKDRNHLHMNATRWTTLTGFVKWMGRKGICHVDHTEKGFFITYIDRDPETLLRNEELAKKDKMAKDDEERQAKVIADMIERGRKLEEAKKAAEGSSSEDSNTSEAPEEKTMLKKESDESKVVFSFAPKKLEQRPVAAGKFNLAKSFALSKKSEIPAIKKEDEADSHEVAIKASVFEASSKDSKEAVKRSLKSSDGPPKKRSALDEIIEEQERWKAKKSERTTAGTSKTWLLPDIIVRVVVKDLGTEFYKKKAIVEKLVDEYGAIIRMVDSGTKVKVDEQHLETVVPREGSRVAVLRGMYRGRKATIAGVDADEEVVELLVDNANVGGRTVPMKFDDVSKVAG